MKELAALPTSFVMIFGTRIAAADFGETIACFNEGTNVGPFMFEITESEMISKKPDGEIRETYRIIHKSADWITSFKSHYTKHFTATEGH
tara:strand:+ start:862 stop:1131 length:270 start_codon:yes stop_codon:yes gene_type:complete